jgi:hypothetical protein
MRKNASDGQESDSESPSQLDAAQLTAIAGKLVWGFVVYALNSLLVV